ncbi:MAG TPA: DUF4124 domain-containing protein [Noviherbaspirillum sp.]|uniref:DUF4124 domain-containing protein n=1 Tax=Noviherbaspirillum sp. TaxID=1926288 RepID=UPI002D3B668B|nr:DUF4124 domain-containing protein [Noviherbaspirillum sp.]HYD95008.1 DUF4124 domain-containing protein [Noviherbaspirillum sp.]
MAYRSAYRFPLGLAAGVLAVFPAHGIAENLPAPAPLGKPASTVYRLVMPDGRIVYSDKPLKGGKVDETLTVDPPEKGTPSAVGSGSRPPLPPRSEVTPVMRVPSVASPKPRSADDAEADVIRAEMLLDDARKRREAGAEPLPGERTGTATGGSRLNDAYHARQKRLAEEVAVAENVLKKAIEARDTLRNGR